MNFDLQKEPGDKMSKTLSWYLSDLNLLINTGVYQTFKKLGGLPVAWIANMFSNQLHIETSVEDIVSAQSKCPELILQNNMIIRKNVFDKEKVAALTLIYPNFGSDRVALIEKCLNAYGYMVA